MPAAPARRMDKTAGMFKYDEVVRLRTARSPSVFFTQEQRLAVRWVSESLKFAIEEL
jgi:hypothetical protein